MRTLTSKLVANGTKRAEIGLDGTRIVVMVDGAVLMDDARSERVLVPGQRVAIPVLTQSGVAPKITLTADEERHIARAQASAYAAQPRSAWETYLDLAAEADAALDACYGMAIDVDGMTYQQVEAAQVRADAAVAARDAHIATHADVRAELARQAAERAAAAERNQWM